MHHRMRKSVNYILFRHFKNSNRSERKQWQAERFTIKKTQQKQQKDEEEEKNSRPQRVCFTLINK